MDLIMREEKPFEIKVTLKQDKLKKYFPKDYTPQKMEEVIIKLLEEWNRKRQESKVADDLLKQYYSGNIRVNTLQGGNIYGYLFKPKK